MRRRPNFAAIKKRNDAAAWATIHARPRPKKASGGLQSSGRPANYRELIEAVTDRGQEFGYAFAHFLDEFYLFRDVSFFSEEPPGQFVPSRRVFLAGVAEFLCHEFSLPVPAWTEKPEYFLDEEWDYVADFDEFPKELHDRINQRRERATPEFRRRNIIYEARNLLRL